MTSILGEDDELGAEILQCRPLTAMKYMIARGGVGGAYIAMPLFFIPLNSFWVALFTALLVSQVAPGPPIIIAFVCCFIVSYLTFFWLTYFHACGDYFILHQHGLQIKMGFKRRRVCFHDLRSISFGKKSRSLNALTNLINVYDKARATEIRQLAGTSINFEYKNGKKVVFGLFLLRFQEEDIRQFWQHMLDNHPNLC